VVPAFDVNLAGSVLWVGDSPSEQGLDVGARHAAAQRAPVGQVERSRQAVDCFGYVEREANRKQNDGRKYGCTPVTNGTKSATQRIHGRQFRVASDQHEVDATELCEATEPRQAVKSGPASSENSIGFSKCSGQPTAQ
jgi:hypothetical protein